LFSLEASSARRQIEKDLRSHSKVVSPRARDEKSSWHETVGVEKIYNVNRAISRRGQLRIIGGDSGRKESARLPVNPPVKHSGSYFTSLLLLLPGDKLPECETVPQEFLLAKGFCDTWHKGPEIIYLPYYDRFCTIWLALQRCRGARSSATMEICFYFQHFSFECRRRKWNFALCRKTNFQVFFFKADNVPLPILCLLNYLSSHDLRNVAQPY